MAQDLNQIAHIVRALQSEPFRMKLTLVDFDSKSPVELLQLAADVFAELDKTQKRDVRDGSPVPEHIEAMKKFVLNLQGASPAALEREPLAPAPAAADRSPRPRPSSPSRRQEEAVGPGRGSRDGADERRPERHLPHPVPNFEQL
jgi:hypothetical protein